MKYPLLIGGYCPRIGAIGAIGVVGISKLPPIIKDTEK
jgi:hypothetical protein